MLKITSLQNPKIKELIKLRGSRERKDTGLFLIEGARELGRALASGFVCKSLYLCPEILNPESRKLMELIPIQSQTELTRPIFAKLAVREGSDGLLAVMEARTWDFSALPPQPWLLVLENVEKPGNFGALARTADGVGVDGIVILDPQADLYNPNAIRASVGALFTRPLITSNSEMFAAFCQSERIRLITASPFAKKFHHEEDLRGAIALVLGSEARGLSSFWDFCEHAQVKIPMLGLADSLNVSVAGAVILYESLRQRLQK